MPGCTEIARCFIPVSHRPQDQRHRVDRTHEMFIAGIGAEALPPPDEYILTAVHSPSLVRDGYREAQEAVTWRSAGRSWQAIADDKLPDPQREARLSRQERMEQNPLVDLALQAAESASKYGPDAAPTKVLMMALQQAMAQIAPQGQTNPPAPGASMEAAPMPQLPGGPATQMPAGMNPADMGDQAAMGQMGAEQGGEFYA
jgi:hypothetical protein